MKLPQSLEKLINEFARLPGIGPKSAQRLALYLLKQDNLDLNSFARAIDNLKAGVTFCNICHTMADTDPCTVCTNPSRDQALVCVVEEPVDAIAIDKTNRFTGVFHVLGGVLNPLEGIGPDKLTINSLLNRIETQGIKEVIIATNPTLEGEATAMHVAKLLTPRGITVTRIARGLPTGGDLEYADEITLSRALEGRRAY